MDAAVDAVVEIFTWVGLGAGALLAGIALIAYLVDGTWVPVRAVVETTEELATLLSRAPDAARSESSLRELMRRGVAGEPVRRELARLLHRSGRAAEAVQLLAPAAASTDPATLDVYGSALADSGRLEDARRVFDRALQLDPARADVLLHRGMLALREKDPGAARDWFTKSLAADPKAAGTLAALGLAQAQLGDSRAALESWDRALSRRVIRRLPRRRRDAHRPRG